jgi:pimeloyl-ACP methyl ester carboxylesterase
VANKLRLINQSVFKFSWFYLKDQQMRRQLYKRWMSTRKLRPDIPLIKSLIRENNISVLLIYGSFDRIMPASAASGFCKNTDGLCQVEILPCGHQIMQPKNEPGLGKVLSALKL